MARVQTMVQLTDDLLTALDAEAARRGASRSAVIREAVVELLARRSDPGRQIVEGYRRVPPATPDEWGSLTASADVSAREVMERLAAEERAEGYEPW